MRLLQTSLLVFVACCAVLCVGCRGGNMPEQYAAATGGNAHRGQGLIVSYDCGSCHTIPGIRHANGLVGPPLISFGRRTFIAGELPNNPSNLVRWITSPQSVEPKTAMPSLGVSDQQARDIAAYLYTLR